MNPLMMIDLVVDVPYLELVKTHIPVYDRSCLLSLLCLTKTRESTTYSPWTVFLFHESTVRLAIWLWKSEKYFVTSRGPIMASVP